MYRRLTLALVPFAMLSPAFAQSSGAPSTQEFVMMAAQSDQFEIQEGQLAAKKGSAAVKKFGEHMVSEHTKTSSQMAAAAQKAGMMAVPSPSLRPDQQTMISQLQNLSGAEFDRAYLTQQVEAHRQALALMQAYAKSGDSAPIKAVAQQAEPIVQSHLQMAEKMAK